MWNKSKTKYGQYALAAGLVLFSTSVFSLPISITANSIGATASDGVNHVQNLFTGTAIPTSTTVNAVSGNSSSLNTINFSGTSSTARLSFDLNHSIDNRKSGTGFSMTHDAYLKFTALIDTTYSISGFYEMTGLDASATIFVSFMDITDGKTLFTNLNYTALANSASFLLDNSGFGSTTGDLIAGNNYQFFFATSLGSNYMNNLYADATGNVTLDIGTASVPEPHILALFGLGLVGICASSCKRKLKKNS